METNYWDIKAKDYDTHTKKSKNAYEKIIELTKNEINNSETLLDIGTGTGTIPIRLADYIDRIVATDYSEEMINVAKSKIRGANINNIDFQIADCNNLDFNDESFDIILAANLIHLLDKPEQFLNSIKKFLKEDGKLILPTFMHNQNILTRIISRVMKSKGHPITTKFDSKSMANFIVKCGYKVDKQILLPSMMPMLFLVATKK